MRNKTSIVTGGAGFVGSHLVERLLERGDRVIVVDNFATGTKETAQILAKLGAEIMEHDVRRSILFKDHVDFVFHLASPASPKDYHALPVLTMETGSAGTHRTCELALVKGARFLLASTSEIYGDPDVHPQVETYSGNVDPTAPRSVYDEAKRYAEALVAHFTRAKRLNGRIVRIFNTYGPRMKLDDGRMVPEFISAALKDKPLPIYGDGSQTRSLCYVSDLVDGLIKMIESDHPGPINLGNPHEMTVLEVASAISQAIRPDKVPDFEWFLLPIGDPKRRKPDISMAKAVLGWEPTVDFDDGILRTVAWFVSENGKPESHR